MLFSKTRTEALSDGVFAIVITLLVLEIKVPDMHASGQSLTHALVGLLPKIISWVISFAVVMIFWINHHRLFHSLTSVDARCMGLNGIFLMGLSFIPFPTALMGEYIHEALAVSLFGWIMALTAGVLPILRSYASKADLFDPMHDKQTIKTYNRRSYILGSGAYAVAALLAWIEPIIAIVLYAVIAMYFIRPKHRHLKQV
ncbi:TMEM175 family protein [bacterium]|nr:TMEM175 family protein [bacterium]NUN45718.1 DUF1211 domain-containing protein [bacterium]